MRVIYGLFDGFGRPAQPGILNPQIGYGIDPEDDILPEGYYTPVHYFAGDLDLEKVQSDLTREQRRKAILEHPRKVELLLNKQLSWRWVDSDGAFGFDLASGGSITARPPYDEIVDPNFGDDTTEYMTFDKYEDGYLIATCGKRIQFPENFVFGYITERSIDALLPN